MTIQKEYFVTTGCLEANTNRNPEVIEAKFEISSSNVCEWFENLKEVRSMNIHLMKKCAEEKKLNTTDKSSDPSCKQIDDNFLYGIILSIY